MGGSSSSEAPKSSANNRQFEERVAEIFEELSRKKTEDLAAEAARNTKTKQHIRDVLEEFETSKKSSSLDKELATRNATLMGILTEMLKAQSQGGNPDNTAKIINLLLDMQQQTGSSSSAAIGSDNAFLAKFIERQLELLQPTQNVKITLETKSSGGGGTGRQQTPGQTSAGPSVAQSAPPKPTPPAYSEVPRPPPERRYQHATPQGNTAFQEGLFPTPPPSYAESVPQAFPYPPPPFKSSPFVDPPHSDRHDGDKKKRLEDRLPFKQDSQGYTKKNNSMAGNDNGPFLDRGPKDGGYRVDQDQDGNFYVKVPPSLLDQPLNGPNRQNDRGGRGGHNYGRGEGPHDPRNQYQNRGGRGGQNYGPNGRGEFPHGPQNQYQNRGGRGGQNYGPNVPHQPYQNQNRGGRGGQYHGPDPRRSASPHHSQHRFQNREDGRSYTPPGNEPSQGPNQEGGFQNRGRGYQRHFQGRGSGHPEHFQNPGEGAFEQPHSYGQQPDGRFQPSEPGNHQPRQGGRWNHQNHRSYSQPRTRHAGQSEEGAGEGQQETDKQGNKAPRGRFRGQGAFSKGKPKAGNPKQKKEQKSKEGVENADPQYDANDSDVESVKSFVSNVSAKIANPKFQVEEGVYVACDRGLIYTSPDDPKFLDATEPDISLCFARSLGQGTYVARQDGTIFTTAEAMKNEGATTTVANVEKKKRNKAKNKVKKASSVTNLSVPENGGAEDDQSDGKEALTPLKLFRAGLADNAQEDPDKILDQAVVLIAKVGNAVESCHPTTFGELFAFKKKHPNAEIIVVD